VNIRGPAQVLGPPRHCQPTNGGPRAAGDCRSVKIAQNTNQKTRTCARRGRFEGPEHSGPDRGRFPQPRCLGIGRLKAATFFFLPFFSGASSYSAALVERLDRGRNLERTPESCGEILQWGQGLPCITFTKDNRLRRREENRARRGHIQRKTRDVAAGATESCGGSASRLLPGLLSWWRNFCCCLRFTVRPRESFSAAKACTTVGVGGGVSGSHKFFTAEVGYTRPCGGRVGPTVYSQQHNPREHRIVCAVRVQPLTVAGSRSHGVFRDVHAMVNPCPLQISPPLPVRALPNFAPPGSPVLSPSRRIARPRNVRRFSRNAQRACEISADGPMVAPLNLRAPRTFRCMLAIY